MNIRIVCVGKLKEQYWRDACAEYAKRLSAFCKLSVVELPEAKLPENASEAQRVQAIAQESDAILSNIRKGEYVIAADVCGKSLSSEELAAHINERLTFGTSSIVFVIGGSCGYNDNVRQRADLRLSFSRLTFPHQLFRVMLLEQIYRACKINSGEKYHK